MSNLSDILYWPSSTAPGAGGGASSPAAGASSSPGLGVVDFDTWLRGSGYALLPDNESGIVHLYDLLNDGNGPNRVTTDGALEALQSDYRDSTRLDSQGRPVFGSSPMFGDVRMGAQTTSSQKFVSIGGIPYLRFGGEYQGDSADINNVISSTGQGIDWNDTYGYVWRADAAMRFQQVDRANRDGLAQWSDGPGPWLTALSLFAAPIVALEAGALMTQAAAPVTDAVPSWIAEGATINGVTAADLAGTQAAAAAGVEVFPYVAVPDVVGIPIELAPPIPADMLNPFPASRTPVTIESADGDARYIYHDANDAYGGTVSSTSIPVPSAGGSAGALSAGSVLDTLGKAAGAVAGIGAAAAAVSGSSGGGGASSATPGAAAVVPTGLTGAPPLTDTPAAAAAKGLLNTLSSPGALGTLFVLGSVIVITGLVFTKGKKRR